MPTVRLVPLSDDDQTIERKKFLFFWRPESTIRSRVNEIEWKIIAAQEAMLKLLAERKLRVEQYERELAYARERSRVNFGRSEPIALSDKEYKEFVAPYQDRPKEDWVEFFHQKIIREYDLKSRGRGQNEMSYRGIQHQRAGHGHGTPIMPGSSGQVTGYTLDEFASKAIHIGEQSGVGQVVSYREDNAKSQGDDKARMKQLRQEYPKQPGESDNEHNNRLQRILKEEKQRQ